MLKKLIVFVMVLFGMLFMAQPSSARDLGDIFNECGIGASIFKDSGTAAAISNIFWDSGTTATSSEATTPESCSGGLAKTAIFINNSYESLEKDLASGDGEYLDTLVTLVGLDAKAEFVENLRKDFSAFVAQTDYTNRTHYEKVEALFNLVNKNV